MSDHVIAKAAKPQCEYCGVRHRGGRTQRCLDGERRERERDAYLEKLKRCPPGSVGNATYRYITEMRAFVRSNKMHWKE
jgi:hypothetical protein